MRLSTSLTAEQFVRIFQHYAESQAVDSTGDAFDDQEEVADVAHQILLSADRPSQKIDIVLNEF
jgi:hypothetical protein